ncbi:methylenetetrahydrofolate reductase [Microbacteriaceae bacterium K1510]|nr:methylenetetrahydrofolate reductase [Microbacteriaceae bacterium K1510]
MPMTAAVPTVDFGRRFSLEATRPDAKEVAALAATLPPGTEIYFTAVPTVGPAEIVQGATNLRKAGLEPVVHIAARRLPNEQHLKDLIAGLRGEADVRRLLVIGGDVDAAGPYQDALAVLQKGRLREAGIETVGIGAYPEGHPRIPPGQLEAALDAKIAVAVAQGLSVHIVSQFSFSPERILAWLQQLRASGIRLPVKVGMAGPTSVPALFRYAKRCGVGASLRGLVSGAATGLIGNVGPDRIIDTLAAASGLGDIAPHYFSFGGVVETARYACEVARRTHGETRAMAHPS